MTITNAEMMAAVSAIKQESFSVIGVLLDGDDHMVVRLRIAGEPDQFAVILPLPTSSKLKPWLSDVPLDAEDAADMLDTFMEEEVLTGCATWGVVGTRGSDQFFELAPYGFRSADSHRHRSLLAVAGPNGWQGRHHENDVPAEVRDKRERGLASRLLSYVDVDLSSSSKPTGYRILQENRQLGKGRSDFDEAARRLMSWEMHRRAGLEVEAGGPVIQGQHARLHLKMGPWSITAPVRVIEIIDESSARGFVYETLEGHPERGEEQFIVRIDDQ